MKAGGIEKGLWYKWKHYSNTIKDWDVCVCFFWSSFLNGRRPLMPYPAPPPNLLRLIITTITYTKEGGKNLSLLFFNWCDPSAIRLVNKLQKRILSGLSLNVTFPRNESGEWGPEHPLLNINIRKTLSFYVFKYLEMHSQCFRIQYNMFEIVQFWLRKALKDL